MLGTSAFALLSPNLRDRWLQHHELALRSSVQTINRYRTATDHTASKPPERTRTFRSPERQADR